MRFASKIIAVATAVAAAFAFAAFMTGCSCSSQQPADKGEINLTSEEIGAENLEVLDSGFTMNEEGVVNYAFIVQNPNAEWMASNLVFKVAGYSVDGTMMFNASETVSRIYPGVTTAVAGSTSVGNPEMKVETFEISPNMEIVTWSKNEMSAEDVETEIEANDVVGTVADGLLTVTASVSTPINKDPDDPAAESAPMSVPARVVAVLVDAEGNILGGGSEDVVLQQDINEMEGPPIEQKVRNDDGEIETILAPGQIENPNAPAKAQVSIDIPGITSYSNIAFYTYPNGKTV